MYETLYRGERRGIRFSVGLYDGWGRDTKACIYYFKILLGMVKYVQDVVRGGNDVSTLYIFLIHPMAGLFLLYFFVLPCRLIFASDVKKQWSEKCNTTFAPPPSNNGWINMNTVWEAHLKFTSDKHFWYTKLSGEGDTQLAHDTRDE